MSDNQDHDLSVQNDFLNQVRKNRTRVSVFLTSGKRLSGRIRSFDRFAILLDAGNGIEEMVFKHAIATITVGSGRAAPSGEGRDPGPRPPRPAEPPPSGD